jgi:hypothetical protein
MFDASLMEKSSAERSADSNAVAARILEGLYGGGAAGLRQRKESNGGARHPCSFMHNINLTPYAKGHRGSCVVANLSRTKSSGVRPQGGGGAHRTHPAALVSATLSRR